MRYAIAIATILLASTSAVAAPPDARAVDAAATSPAAPAHANRSALLDALGSSELGQVERAVTAIAAPDGDGEADPDMAFAAARACEDKLDDPARALALYDRITAQHPDARVAAPAARRAAALRELVGPHGETAALARGLAQLIARADAEPVDAVIRRGSELAAAAWPGAPRAALWLADWLRRSGRFTDADARYAQVMARWPDSPESRGALRGAAGSALDARDWSRAEALAARLPATDPAERIVRDDLLAAAARGRQRDRWYTASWLAIAGAFAALLASLAEAALRGTPGRGRLRALRPPIEVAFLAPVAAVLIGVAFTAHRLIAPAVATIAIGGVGLAWLSGAALEQLRATGRPRRLRAIAHVLACLAAVAALAYVAITRDNLLDALVETVRFGPDS